MTCHELIDFLGDYLADELPPEQRAEFERHLAVCKHCRWYLDSYRATIALGQAGFARDEAAMPEELVQAILAARAA